MSGSNSSVQDANEALTAEPVSFTVHDVALPAREQQTRAGRWKMLLVLAVCAAPVVASYLTFYVIRPQGRTNYGALIAPTRALPAAFDSLKGQWLLVVVGPADCTQACEQRLFMQRQLREMMGRERDRIDKVWFVTGGEPAPALRQALEAVPGMHVIPAERESIARWLEPEAGHALEDHLYIVDPLGEWMMRMPADADPQRVKRDLDKLLRASAGWDKAGR